MENQNTHWSILLEEVRELKAQGQKEEAYYIARSIYESNTFRYDKAIHANYEHYIEEKVKFFLDLASLSMFVTDKPEQSIPYLDEALVLIDGSESVRPYIDLEEIKRTRRDYVQLAKNKS